MSSLTMGLQTSRSLSKSIRPRAGPRSRTAERTALAGFGHPDARTILSTLQAFDMTSVAGSSQHLRTPPSGPNLVAALSSSPPELRTY